MSKLKDKKTKIVMGIVFVLILIGLLAFMLSGDNKRILIDIFVKDIPKDELQDHLSGFGWKGYVTLGLLSVLQVVFTFVPAEPIQVVAGVSFGLIKGVACCFAGVLLGNTVIFVLYHIYGDKLKDYFDKKLDIDFEQAASSKRVALIVIILGLLPAIPYGLICFFAATLKMKYPRYIMITGLGALPSIVLDVGLGHVAVASSWILSIVVLVVLIILLIIMAKKRKLLFEKVNAYIAKTRQPYSSSCRAKKPKPSFMKLMLFFCGFYFGPRVKLRFKKSFDGELEHPSLILVNHGSFLDFYYMGKILKNERVNFITNRMYFYKGFYKKYLQKVGCFPKSMFQSDMENAKNCVRVLADNGVITFMPEARLSTVGSFEGIQDVTYRFIKRAGVTVYACVLHGDYFARPKWGDKIRKGSLVEGELVRIYTADELKSATLEEVEQRVNETLDYDEYEWLKTKPELKYKSKTLAVGLENILTECPKCGARYSFTSKKRTLACSECGFTATLDDRYAFVDKEPFENPAEWYDWQTERLKREFEKPDHKLESRVLLKHASTDGKTLLRVAGEGTATLSRDGLTYSGTEDGKEIVKFFPIKQIYRLLFGAGEDFELYDGREIWYFVPDEPRSCVDWYIASGFLRDEYDRLAPVENEKPE